MPKAGKESYTPQYPKDLSAKSQSSGRGRFRSGNSSRASSSCCSKSGKGRKSY